MEIPFLCIKFDFGADFDKQRVSERNLYKFHDSKRAEGKHYNICRKVLKPQSHGQFLSPRESMAVFGFTNVLSVLV